MLNEKAVRIAMETFLSEWEGDADEVFEQLRFEERDWWDIDYATVWVPFEDVSVGSVYNYIRVLAEAITVNFGE